MTLFTHTSTDTLHRLTQTPADKHIIAQIHTITERIRLSREDTQRLPPGAHSRSVVLVCNGGSAAVGRSGVGLPSSVPLLRPQLLPLTHAHSMSTLKCVCPFSVSIFSGGLQLHVFWMIYTFILMATSAVLSWKCPESGLDIVLSHIYRQQEMFHVRSFLTYSVYPPWFMEVVVPL